MVLDVIYWVACVVLVVSGAAKLIDPKATEATIRQFGLPTPRFAGRIVGVAEVLVGAAGLLAVPGAVAQVAAVLVALLYGSFAVVVWAAHKRGLQDCGCLGVQSRAPSPGHAVLNLALALAAGASAVLGPVDLPGGLGDLSLTGSLAVGLSVAVLAGLVVART